MTAPKWLGLQDVVAAHRAAPRTYSIPRADQRTRLRVGDVVKLVFEVDLPAHNGPTAERMWVEVREVWRDRYVGALDNQPSFISDLKPGDLIEFGPEHVNALYRSSSGLALPHGLFALVSVDVATGGAWPTEARREPPMSPESSGWVVRGPKGDDSELVQMPIDDLLQQFRVLDSVLDEPVGSRWIWDVSELEYRHQP
jgi:hypothetical protein